MYTELKVIQSASGYYIGRDYADPECDGAGTRESDYFDTCEEAQQVLESGFVTRQCEKNLNAYLMSEIDTCPGNWSKVASKDFNDFPFYGRRVSVGTLPGSYGPVVVTGGEYVGYCGIYQDDDDDSTYRTGRAVVYLEGEKNPARIPYCRIRRIGYFDPDCARR